MYQDLLFYERERQFRARWPRQWRKTLKKYCVNDLSVQLSDNGKPMNLYHTMWVGLQPCTGPLVTDVQNGHERQYNVAFSAVSAVPEVP